MYIFRIPVHLDGTAIACGELNTGLAGWRGPVLCRP